MTTRSRFLLYGATGYTGKLIARLAARRGAKPILAGRSRAALRAVADPLGLDYRVAPLNQPSRLDSALAGVDLVLHCAGPFSGTWRPMFEACLRTGTHYADVAGEIAVFEALHERGEEAAAAGLMVLPGLAFDVVPLDCLAAHLRGRLPSATDLRFGIALRPLPRLSRGSVKTLLEQIDTPAMIRQDGGLIAAQACPGRSFDFGDGLRSATTFSSAAVTSAYRLTGVPNVEVYFESTATLQAMLTGSRMFGWALSSLPIQILLQAEAQLLPQGPTDAQRAASYAVVVGELEDADSGQIVRSRLRTPEAYTIGAEAALAVVERVLAGEVRPGLQTTAELFGPDFILGFRGVRREDLDG